MALVSRRTLIGLTLLSFAGLIAGFAAVWFGFYNVAADDPHTRPLYWLLENVRDRSIAARASELTVPPDLDARERIVQGAGNYDAMCTGCHLTPESGPTELSSGLYPAPPDLASQLVDPARAFWVMKHGIKASGMPAWGRSMDDAYLWNMVAFLQVLPELDADGYRELVGASEGHSHGGGETDGHAHASGEVADHHADEESTAPHAHDEAMARATPDEAAAVPASEGTTHLHADGSTHVHAPKPAAPSTAVPPAKSIDRATDATPAPATADDAAPVPATTPEPETEPEPASEEPAEDHSHHDHEH